MYISVVVPNTLSLWVWKSVDRDDAAADAIWNPRGFLEAFIRHLSYQITRNRGVIGEQSFQKRWYVATGRKDRLVARPIIALVDVDSRMHCDSHPRSIAISTNAMKELRCQRYQISEGGGKPVTLIRWLTSFACAVQTPLAGGMDPQSLACASLTPPVDTWSKQISIIIIYKIYQASMKTGASIGISSLTSFKTLKLELHLSMFCYAKSSSYHRSKPTQLDSCIFQLQ